MHERAFIQDSKTSYTLNEFLSEIKKALDNKFKRAAYWVHGELSDWKRHGAHYYGELIEYDESSSQSIAKIKVNLWANLAKKIISKFHHITGEEISSGMKVLLLVNVNFHNNYGLSLNIIDVDPSFTLGDREARKKKILTNLFQKGIADNNKKLSTPREFFRVAVISSETAAGLGDFFAEANILQKRNLCNFEIYRASMQGKDCPIEVAGQLRTIHRLISNNEKQYDAIVLIRGGGSQADLDWFNHIEPANAVCQMMIPVFVGIGHERDSTILDFLANRSFDTPSKVINFIASTIMNNAKDAQRNFNSLKDLARNLTVKNKDELIKQAKYISYFSSLSISGQKKQSQDGYILIYRNAKQQLKYHAQTILNSLNAVMTVSKKHIELLRTRLENIKGSQESLCHSFLERHKKQLLNSLSSLSKNFNSLVLFSKNKIERAYKNILSLAIEPTLKRGFTLTEVKGKYVTSAREAEKINELIVIYHDGKIKTEVKHDKTIK